MAPPGPRWLVSQEFVAGCAKGGPTSATCECIYRQLTTKRGLSTEGKLKQVLVQVQAASALGTLVVSALPRKFTAPTTACKSGGGSGATQ